MSCEGECVPCASRLSDWRESIDPVTRDDAVGVSAKEGISSDDEITHSLSALCSSGTGLPLPCKLSVSCSDWLRECSEVELADPSSLSMCRGMSVSAFMWFNGNVVGTSKGG